jgi:hypothetical protein
LRDEIESSNPERLIAKRAETQKLLESNLKTADTVAVDKSIQQYDSISEKLQSLGTKGAENLSISSDSSQIMSSALWMLLRKNGSDNQTTNPIFDDDTQNETWERATEEIGNQLADDLGLTSDQIDTLLTKREQYEPLFKRAIRENRMLVRLIQQLDEKRASLAHFHNISQAFREHVVDSILDVGQQAKFRIWLGNNKQSLDQLFE